MTCPICLKAEIVDKHTTICNHSFCKVCIDTWLEQKYTCPCCRAVIKEEEVDITVIDEDIEYEYEEFEFEIEEHIHINRFLHPMIGFSEIAEPGQDHRGFMRPTMRHILNGLNGTFEVSEMRVPDMDNGFLDLHTLLTSVNGTLEVSETTLTDSQIAELGLRPIGSVSPIILPTGYRPLPQPPSPTVEQERRQTLRNRNRAEQRARNNGRRYRR